MGWGRRLRGVHEHLDPDQDLHCHLIAQTVQVLLFAFTICLESFFLSQCK